MLRAAALRPPEPALAERRLLHDLQVHQIELEQQNRLLRDAQRGLEVSRSRYADLFDFAPIGYCTLDARGRLREVNLAAASLLGTSRDGLIGRPLVALVGPSSRAAFQTHLARASEGNTTAVEVEFLVGGDTVTTQLLCSPTPGPDGRPDGCRAALVDVTAAKDLEGRLRFLSNVGELAASPLDYPGTLSAIAHLAVPFLADVCLVDLLDDDGRLFRVESAFADAQAEVRWAPRLPRPGPDRPVSAAVRVAQSRMPMLHAELEPGGELDAAGLGSMLLVPLMARERTLGTMTFAVSKTRRRYGPRDLALAEEVARRAATALDNARLLALQRRDTRFREDLLSIVSHDLKSPLSSVLLVVTRLLGVAPKQPVTPARLMKDLERVQHAAERMSALIQSLLDAASLEAGRLSIERGRVVLSTLIADALEAFQPLAASSSILLESKLEPGLPDVLADPARIQQVLANLIGNAIKFTPSQGRITVSAAPSAEGALLCVVDTGAGIPKDELEHLFDRFWQSRRGASAGTGLGLFIVKGIIEGHGGRLWVESEPGAGARFCFTLPEAPADAAPAELARAAKALVAEHRAQTAELERVTAEAPSHDDRKTANEGLRLAHELTQRAWRAQPAFLSLVSHELRSPLTALLLELERIERSDARREHPDLEVTVRKMFGAVERLTRAVDSMLLEGLVESGALQTEVRPFDAALLARDVLSQFSGPANEKGLALTLATGPGPTSFDGDEHLTRAVLTNLVDNAIKFTERGEVAIEVRRRDGTLELQVSDTGPGIPPGERARIFEPFAQLVSPRNKHLPGLGLGLALVDGITRALGGEVRVESSEPSGSTFTVHLPKREAGAQGAAR